MFEGSHLWVCQSSLCRPVQFKLFVPTPHPVRHWLSSELHRPYAGYWMAFSHTPESLYKYLKPVKFVICGGVRQRRCQHRGVRHTALLACQSGEECLKSESLVIVSLFSLCSKTIFLQIPFPRFWFLFLKANTKLTLKIKELQAEVAGGGGAQCRNKTKNVRLTKVNQNCLWP